MTPAEIAVLRRMEDPDWEHVCASPSCDMRHVGPYVKRMLGEIERLQGLLGPALAHTHSLFLHWQSHTAHAWLCRGCKWSYTGHPDETDGFSENDVKSAHAAHVAEILDSTP